MPNAPKTPIAHGKAQSSSLISAYTSTALITPCSSRTPPISSRRPFSPLRMTPISKATWILERAMASKLLRGRRAQPCTTPQLGLIEPPAAPAWDGVSWRNSLGYHALGDLAFKLPYTCDISASDYDHLAGLLDVPDRGSGHGGGSPRGPGQRAREWRRHRRLLGERRRRPRADPEARSAAAAASRRAAQRRGDRVRRPLAARRCHSPHRPSRHLASRDRGAFRATRCCARRSADSDRAPDAVRAHRRAATRPRHDRRTRRKA